VRRVTLRPSPALAAALAAIPLLLACAPARAELPPDAIARALVLARSAALTKAPPGARVLATPGTLDSRLRLAPCAQVEPYLAGGQPIWGRTRVGMRCLAGATWNVFLPVRVQVLAPVWVGRAALPAGARLTEDQLERAEADWAAAPSPPVLDAATAAGRVLARPLQAGQTLRQSDLQPRQWFASGQVVRVVAHGAGYAVSTDGQALSAGLEGQPVRVRTDNGRVLVGRAVAENRVEVGP
jgi:flagellar basal body P-ring formation protein FlgA